MNLLSFSNSLGDFLGGRGALSAARPSSSTLARGPVPARVPRECKISVLGRPTRAILELLLMLSQPLWFPCSRFGLKRPTSTRLTFILGPIMKYHHFMGPGMLGTCWVIIRYQFWNENPLLLLENQALHGGRGHLACRARCCWVN